MGAQLTAAENKRARRRRYYERNRDKISAKAKKWAAENVEHRRTYQAEYRARNRDQLTAAAAARYVRQKDELNAKNRAWHAANRDRVREYKRRRRIERPDIRFAAKLRAYGLTRAQHDAMLIAQSGLCAICCDPFGAGRLQGPHVDHCHRTGKVRGLLCRRCNSMLGYVNDCAEILNAAATYVDQHRA